MMTLTMRFALSGLALLLLTACGDDPAPEVDVPSWAKVAPEQIAEAKKLGVPVAFENDLGMRFVLIPAGTFLMGSPEDEEGRDEDETQHEVTISKPFYMSIYEVTNGEFRAWKPGHDTGEYEGKTLNGDRRPVGAVTLDDARAYADWVSSRARHHVYGIPGEEAWEYACRAGTTTPFATGLMISSAQANYNGYRVYGSQPRGIWRRQPTDVASFPANRWGLYDMHGNVCEWCSTPYTDKETWVETDGGEAVLRDAYAIRGGSWQSRPTGVRSATRRRFPVDTWAEWLGFRLVSSIPEPGER